MTEAVAPDSGELFQEYLKEDPFWMIVACVLINRTHWRQVKPVLEALRKRCINARGIVHCPDENISEIVKSLGFQNRRTATLKRLALAWTDERPRTSSDVMRLPGCGPYAAQSWLIFIENKRPALGTVTDHKLQWYIENKM